MIDGITNEAENIDKDNGNMVYKNEVNAANSFMKPRFF